MSKAHAPSISAFLTYSSNRTFYGQGPVAAEKGYYHGGEMRIFTSNGSLTPDVMLTIKDAPSFVDAMCTAALTYTVAYVNARTRAMKDLAGESAEDRQEARAKLADAFEAAAKRLRASKNP